MWLSRPGHEKNRGFSTVSLPFWPLALKEVFCLDTQAVLRETQCKIRRPPALWGSHLGSESSRFSQAFRWRSHSQQLNLNLMRDCDRTTQLSHSQTSILKTSRIKDPRGKKKRPMMLQTGSHQGHRWALFCLHNVLMLISCQHRNRVHACALGHFSHQSIPMQIWISSTSWKTKSFHSYRSKTGQTEQLLPL